MNRHILTLFFSLVLLFLSYKFGQLSHYSSLPKIEQTTTQEIKVEEEKIESDGHQDLEFKQSIETISMWAPRVQLFKSFLSASECKQIIALGEPELIQEKGDEKSWGYPLFVHVYEKLPLLRNIEKRIAKWTQLPEENGEHFYLVKEQEGNIAKNFHVDYFTNDTEWGRNELDAGIGNRIATIYINLQKAEEGGDIHFIANGEKQIAFPLQIGDAALIYALHPDSTVDPSSAHATKPIIKGTHYSLIKWIREKNAKSHSWREGLTDDQKAAFEREDLLFERKHVRINKIH